MLNRYVDRRRNLRGTLDVATFSERDREAFAHALRCGMVRFVGHCEPQPAWGDANEVAEIERAKQANGGGVT
jgi:hypothetical protein